MSDTSRYVDRTAASAVVLAVGIAVGGWFVGHGFLRGRTASRYVEVKGLAEREVAADLALWPLRFVTTGDDLAGDTGGDHPRYSRGLTRLGAIRYANQGIFVILPRDQAPGVNEGGQLQKIVRVVSTVQYLLE